MYIRKRSFIKKFFSKRHIENRCKLHRDEKKGKILILSMALFWEESYVSGFHMHVCSLHIHGWSPASHRHYYYLRPYRYTWHKLDYTTDLRKWVDYKNSYKHHNQMKSLLKIKRFTPKLHMFAHSQALVLTWLTVVRTPTIFKAK